MAVTRVSLEIPDADGCLYNHDYLAHTRIAAYKYGPALKAFHRQIPLPEETMVKVRLLIEQIRAEVKHGYDMDRHSEVRVSAEDVIHFIAHLVLLEVEVYEEINDLVYTEILLARNPDLVQSILSRKAEYDALVFMVGSQRQCAVYDKLGQETNGTGSIFADILMLKRAFRRILPDKTVSVNKLTVTDAHYRREPGDTFRRALKRAVPHHTHICDFSKLSIIYGAVHHAVVKCKKKYGEVELTANFYDDLKHAHNIAADILNALISVFTRYPQLLPYNTTLKLHHYDGKLHETVTIAGKGPVDYRFTENIRLMAAMCGHNLIRLDKEYDAARQLDVDEFLLRRVTGTELVPYITHPHLEAIQTDSQARRAHAFFHQPTHPDQSACSAQSRKDETGSPASRSVSCRKSDS